MSLNAFASLIFTLAIAATMAIAFTWEPKPRRFPPPQPEIVFRAITVARRECVEVGREHWCRATGD